jgi:hypothetical protein
MSVLNTIVLACAHLHPKRTLARLRENEKEYIAGARWYRETSRDGKAGTDERRKTGGKRYHE